METTQSTLRLWAIVITKITKSDGDYFSELGHI